MCKKLSDLHNIGKVLEEELIKAGIDTPKKLMEIGSEEAWLKLKENDPTSCLHKLYALEGAVRGVYKKELDDDVKNKLREFCQNYK